MKLSEQELRWLDCWEKHERQWIPFRRWVLVANGIFSSIMGAFLWYLVAKLSAELAADGVSASVPGLLVSFPIVFFGNAAVCFGIAISKWRGDIKLRLLLRLIREHANTDS